MLTGVELGAVLPGPALKQGAVDDQLGRGVQVLHDWYLVAEGAGCQGCVGTNHPGGGGLGDAVDLGEQPLGKVVPQPGSRSGAHTGTPPALNRPGFGGGSDDAEGSLSWDRRKYPDELRERATRTGVGGTG